MNQLATIERPNLSLCLPGSLPFEQWVEMGRRLCASSLAINWHIGDWWAFGEQRYGDRAKAAAEGVFGLSFQSLKDCGFVARAFEPSRRRDVVSFTHHREVASLPASLADELLEKAESDLLSTRELRRLASAARTASLSSRKRDYIDIRPQRIEEPAAALSRDDAIVHLATELGKLRRLTDMESDILDAALRRLSREEGRRTEEWGGEQDVELISLLRDGKRPPTIAPTTDRTEGAIWRRIYKLGGLQSILAQGSGEEWPIRKV